MRTTFKSDAAAAVYHRRSPRQRFRATMRDTWVLIREFRVGLLLFVLVLLLGTLSWMLLWRISQPNPMRFIEALFHILSMIFMQAAIEFPQEWYLDIYFFIMPVLGLIAVGHGLTNFAAMLFNRSSRQSQWEEAVASTYKHHIVLTGLGHVGIRILRELVILDEDIVVIERKADSPTLDEVRSYDIPIIVGDARNIDSLKRAGVDRASAVIICTNNDLANLQIATRVQEMNPDARIVMRVFDDSFARAISERFGINAVLSTSMMAAPAFAGAATGIEIVQTFQVAEKVLVMSRITVQPGCQLDGITIREIEEVLDISVVLVQSNNTVDVTPPHDLRLKGDDVIAVVAEIPQIQELARHWNVTTRR